MRMGVEVPGVDRAEYCGPVPVYEHNYVEPRAEEGNPPVLSIQFIFMEVETDETTHNSLEVLRTGASFPHEMFVKKKEGQNDSPSARYFLGIETRGEVREFNRIVIKAENVRITDTIAIKSKVKSLMDDGDGNVENPIIVEDELKSLNIRHTLSSKDNGSITATLDITNHILDIEHILGAHNNNSRVPSVKKCTIKISVSRSGIPFPPLVFENQKYTVWKKLISSYEVVSQRNGNMGDPNDEKRLAMYLGDFSDFGQFEISSEDSAQERKRKEDGERDLIIKSPHLFYYRFTYPNSIGDSRIFIRIGQVYKDIKANDIESKNEDTYLMRRNSNKMYLMHRNCHDTEGRLKMAIELADKTYVNITHCFTNTNLNFSSPPLKLSELIGIEEFKSGDDAWVERFQKPVEPPDYRHYISMHCYGIAVDINNLNYYNNMRYGTWNQSKLFNWNETGLYNYESIKNVLSLLTYGKCEEKKLNGAIIERNYFFQYKCDEHDYENRALKYVFNPRDYFNIRHGWALVNWFLFHLVFKQVGFFWGGYFRITDAMHFSLTEKVDELDYSFSAYPPPLNKQQKFEDTRRNVTVYNPKNELVFQGITIEKPTTDSTALLVLTFDKHPTILTVNNIRVSNATMVSIVPRGTNSPQRKISITGAFSTAKDITVAIVNPPPDYVFLMPNEQYDRSLTRPITPPQYTVRVQSDRIR